MKIAILSHHFPPGNFGGVSTYCYDLANALTINGFDVTVYCGSNKKVKEDLKSKFKIVRLKMLDLPPRSFWFQLQNLIMLKNQFRNHDLIIGQSTSSGLVFLNKNSIKKPLITVFHDTPLSELRSFVESGIRGWRLNEFVYSVLEYPIYHFMNLVEVKKSDYVVAVGYSILGHIKKEFDLKDNYSVIQNGIDLNKIDYILKDKKEMKSDKIKIIFYGRLYYRKGITFLLGAIKIVVEKFKNVELSIYGSGPLNNIVRKTIERNNLSTNVKIYGFIKNEDLIKKIGSSDIVVLPSLHEAFSIAYLEAMACKKALIVFDYPFSRELITNMKNGILARQKDIEDLANKITLLINDNKLRNGLGQYAYKKVSRDHHSKDVINKYIKLINQLVK